MCQTQLMSSAMAGELFQSIGLELTLFAITLTIALAFRGITFRKDAGKSQKSTTKPFAKARPTDLGRQCRERNVACIADKKVSKCLSQRTPSPTSGGCDRIKSLIAFARRGQSAEAISIYEEMKASDQYTPMKDFTSSKESATDICKLLVQCAGSVGRPDLVGIILDDMVQAGIDRPLGFYEVAMKMLAAKKYYKEAISVCTWLDADRLEPSSVTLSSLVHFAVEIGEPARAIEFFNRLASVTTPSIRAYMTILRVHSKRQNWAKSVEVIRDMQLRQAPIDSIVLNVVLATGVAAGELDAVVGLLEEFSEVGIADVVSYNTLMKGLAQQKEVDRALKLLDEMINIQLKPTAITFNTAIDAAVRSGRVVDAWSVFTRMHDAGLAPDKFTCTTLMKGLQDGATAQQLTLILDILQSIAAEGDLGVCGSLFCNVIEAAAEVNEPKLTARAIAEMRQQRVLLPPNEYHRLLRVLLRDGESSAATSISKPHVRQCNPRPWRKQCNPICQQSPLEAVRPISVH